MNHKRAIGFGVMLWLSMFVAFFILMGLLKLGSSMLYPIVWILLIPIILLLAKWYFKMDPPTTMKGLCLGLIGVGIGLLLDMVITAPFIIKSYMTYFSTWQMYVIFFEIIALCTYAGWEFDKTYTPPEKTSPNIKK